MEVRVAILETDFKNHLRSDEERYGRIEKDVAHILTVASDIKQTLTHSTQRIHERIDTEVMVVRHDTSGMLERLHELKLWLLSGSALMLLGVAVFFIAPFFARGMG